MPTGMYARKRSNTHELFLSHVEMVTESGCWLWTASMSKTGYGVFWNRGKHIRAHRYAYIVYRGEIPEGMSLDHLCRVRCCVNPWHLEPVTHLVNMQRGWMANKPNCKMGHPLSGDNLLNDKRQRTCRICHRVASNKYLEKKRGQQLVP